MPVIRYARFDPRCMRMIYRLSTLPASFAAGCAAERIARQRLGSLLHRRQPASESSVPANYAAGRTCCGCLALRTLVEAALDAPPMAASQPKKRETNPVHPSPEKTLSRYAL